MSFWEWANRKSESVIEMALKLMLAIILLAGFSFAFMFVTGRVNLDGLLRPQLTADSCANPAVAESVQGLFVDAYNQQAWFGHFLPQDVSLDRQIANEVRVDVGRVNCTGWITIGMQHPQERRVSLPVSYSVQQQSDSSDLYVQYAFRAPDFMGKGLGSLAREGVVQE